LQFSFGSNTGVINRLHFTYSGGAPSSSQCSTIAAAIVLSAKTHTQTLTAVDRSLNNAVVTDLTSPSAGQGAGGVPWTGTFSPLALAAGTAMLFTGTIGRRYRGGKPRTYSWMGTAADLDPVSGEWRASESAAFLSAWTGFISGCTAITVGATSIVGPASVSYYEGFTNVAYGTPTKYRRVPTLRSAPVIDPILTYSMNPKPTNQRRRNRGL
jgi:hypothetical protein